MDDIWYTKKLKIPYFFYIIIIYNAKEGTMKE